MRRLVFTVLLPLTCLTITATAAEKIPQDRAAADKRSRESLEWNRRTLVEAYDKVGKKDPRWDAKAHEALELAARMFSQQIDPEVNPSDIQKPAKAAKDAGCTDPLVAYLQTRTDPAWYALPPAEAAKSMAEIAKNLAASKYPAIRRAAAHRYAGDALCRAGVKDRDALKQAKEQFDAFLALLPAGLAEGGDDPLVQERWYDLLKGTIPGYRATGEDALAVYEKVDAALAKLPKLGAVRSKLAGGFWYDYGWEARGQSFANQVSPGGAAKFGERLTKARTALEKSWSLQPDAKVAVFLIDIDKSIGGDRQNMETWFGRAMKLNPDARDACFTKLDWLDPKWHGTREEMVAFGRACLATGNWRNGITLLVADAHHRFTRGMSDAARAQYFASAPAWSDIATAYDEYLKHYPDDVGAKSKYAIFCHLAGHDREAHALFQQLGDNLTMWTEFPYFPLETMKRMRAEAAQAAAAHPGDDGQPKASGAPVLP